jgi:hypothetical protein
VATSTVSKKSQINIILRKVRAAEVIKHELARSPAIGFFIAF